MAVSSVSIAPSDLVVEKIDGVTRVIATRAISDGARSWDYVITLQDADGNPIDVSGASFTRLQCERIVDIANAQLSAIAEAFHTDTTPQMEHIGLMADFTGTPKSCVLFFQGNAQQILDKNKPIQNNDLQQDSAKQPMASAGNYILFSEAEAYAVYPRAKAAVDLTASMDEIRTILSYDRVVCSSMPAGFRSGFQLAEHVPELGSKAAKKRRDSDVPELGSPVDLSRPSTEDETIINAINKQLEAWQRFRTANPRNPAFLKDLKQYQDFNDAYIQAHRDELQEALGIVRRQGRRPFDATPAGQRARILNELLTHVIQEPARKYYFDQGPTHQFMQGATDPDVRARQVGYHRFVHPLVQAIDSAALSS